MSIPGLAQAEDVEPDARSAAIKNLTPDKITGFPSSSLTENILKQKSSNRLNTANSLQDAENPNDQTKPFKEETSDFQRFVFMSTGQKLQNFGQNLFESTTSTYTPIHSTPVMADYLLGPGDELQIMAWGGIDVELSTKVDRNGQIYIPKIGAIRVAGIQAGEVESYLKSKIGRSFHNFNLNVTLGQLRSIQIYVVGHAKRPGTYTLSSLSTLVNALFASGGPSPSGSMRNIQLKRNGQVLTELDLYDFITKGDKQADTRLMPGDIIVMPPLGPQVAVIGPQRLQAIYELKNKESTIARVLEIGGGLPILTTKHLALLERLDPKQIPARTTQNLELNSTGLATSMQDGDILSLRSIGAEIGNAVTLRGNVATPIRHPYKTGMRISDLIPNREALIHNDYFIRKNQLVQFTQTDETVNKTKLINDLKHIFDEVNWEYAVIERIDSKQLITTLITFNLAKAVIEEDPKENLELQPGDVVTIFSKKDVQVPQSKSTRLIRIEGEVVKPGIFQAMPGETLRQLLARIGGVTPEAYLYAAEFYRESTRQMQQTKLDSVLDRMEKSLTLSSSQSLASSLSPEDAISQTAQQDFNRQVLSRLRAVKATGRIVLEVPAKKASIAFVPDIPLEDGDRLLVPSTPSVVNVVGEVNNENAFLYSPGKSLSDYLKQAGGATRDGDKAAIYVLKADGSMIASTNNWFSGWFNDVEMMPGDTIVVPILATKKSWVKDLRDWTQILYQFGMGMAGLKVLKDL